MDTVSELTSSTPPSEPQFVLDSALEPGECVLKRKAIAGSTYQSYRVYSLNGEIIRRVPIDKTEYPMHPALYAVGQGNHNRSELWCVLLALYSRFLYNMFTNPPP